MAESWSDDFLKSADIIKLHHNTLCSLGYFSNILLRNRTIGKNFLIKLALSYSNQFIDLQSKSMDWFLYDNSPRHERVKSNLLGGD